MQFANISLRNIFLLLNQKFFLSGSGTLKDTHSQKKHTSVQTNVTLL